MSCVLLMDVPMGCPSGMSWMSLGMSLRDDVLRGVFKRCPMSLEMKHFS